MKATIAEIVQATAGRLVQGDPAARAIGVTTDTRSIFPGQLFIALPGDKFDGHDFVGKALEAGAAAALVARLPEGLATDRPLVLVDDTVAAYQAMGAWWRARVPATVIGITGSNGKTTTKSLLTLALGALGPTMCSEANNNNHLGVPQTLLRIVPEHRFAVVEMGVNHFGEMAPLARTARPNVALITNIGRTHIEAFGSPEGVAREKSVMLDYLAADGLAVLPADDPWSRGIAARHPGRKVTFGLSPDADWRAARLRLAADHISFVVERTGDKVTVPVVGALQVGNCIGAIAAAAELGVPVPQAADALSRFKPPKWRMDVRRVNGMTLLLDCYNANPSSMLGAVAELARRRSRRGRRVAVLGDMLELGEISDAAHREVGAAVAGAGIDLLCAIGERAEALADQAIANGMDSARVLRTRARDEAAGWLRGNLSRTDTVLFKASRGVRLEEVADAVLAWATHE